MDPVNATVRLTDRKAAVAKATLCLLCLVLLALAWRFTPLKRSVDFAALLRWQQSLKDHPAALFWVVGAYLIGGLVLFPVMILNVATIVAFGPFLGNVYAFAGWLCSAACGFGIARIMGSELVQRLASGKVPHLFHRFAGHGFLAVLGLRLLPIVPFTIVNLFVGASGIRFVDFFFATALGRIPGIVALTLFGVQLENFLRRPEPTNSLLLALPIVFVPLAVGWLYQRFVPPKSHLKGTR
jgi:uncharacterized membrane protein YdjX (TVP38/TMEM64 family)